MQKYYLCIYILVFIFSCSQRYEEKTVELDFLSPESKMVIKTNAELDYLRANFNDIPLREKTFDTLFPKLTFLNPISDIYIGIENKVFTISTKSHDSIISSVSASNIISEKIKSKNITRTIYNNDTLYHKNVDSIFIASNSMGHLLNIKATKNPKLKTLFSISAKNSNATIYHNDSLNSILLNNDLAENGKTIVDFKNTSNSIVYNGILRCNDTSAIINQFANTKPMPFMLANIIPSNVNSVDRIGFDDYENFTINNSEIQNDSITNFLKFTSEIACVRSTSAFAIFTTAIDKNLAMDSLGNLELIENYREVPIYNFNYPNYFTKKVVPLVKLYSVQYFFNLDDYFVFSDNISVLKSIIVNKLNNQTLALSEKFRSVTASLAEESHILIYKDEKGLSSFLNDNANGYNSNAVQFIYENNFSHINGIFSKYKKEKKSNSISEDFTLKLNADISMKPHPVKNYMTNEFDLITQDTNNVVYLISNTGQIRWKKQLNSPILGKVKQIDTYKNGRLQFTFATANEVFVLDRNGKNVGNFPLKFNQKITQPLSVFDYDKKRNYRLLVTQNKNLLMYDAKGKRVAGFKYKGAVKPISSKPKHFRILSKDYIVFSQGNTLEILNRQGRQRIRTKNKIDFSKNEIYKYRNKFVTLNSNNQLTTVDTKGNVDIEDLEFQDNAVIDATTKTIVFLDGNKLKINNKTIDLDFGNYTTPKIFYTNNKLYISVTDLQSKKIYVHDSQGKLIPNFPVFGSASVNIENLDKRGKPEIITQSDNRTILVYKMN